MSEQLYDFATQKAAISGHFSRNYELNLQWLPQYVEEFPKAMNGVKINWEKCKFVPDAQSLVPDNHGVYCFSINLGQPFPQNIHLPLYIGKAAPGYLSERFKSYFCERESYYWSSKASSYAKQVSQSIILLVGRVAKNSR
jgi:hypothetical protein